MVLLDVRMNVVKVERSPRDSIVFFQRLGHTHDVRRVDRLRRDISAAERLDRARPLEREQLILFDHGRRKIVGTKDFITCPSESLT